MVAIYLSGKRGNEDYFVLLKELKGEAKRMENSNGVRGVKSLNGWMGLEHAIL